MKFFTKKHVLAGAALSGAAVLAVASSLLVGAGSAATAAPPTNTSPPTITGSPVVGQTLTAHVGTWTGSPTSYAYQWRRCDENGGSCADISAGTSRTYTLRNVDAGNTLRVRVTARNADGSGSATSVPTAVIRRPTSPPPPPVTGCPPGQGPVSVNDVKPPARLIVDRIEWSPSVVTRSTSTVVGRYHVIDTCGQAVRDALVRAAAVPFNQVTASEEPTDASGWATIHHQILRGFPAGARQQLLVFFVRARKQGDSLLAGISGRRLVSVRVNLG